MRGQHMQEQAAPQTCCCFTRRSQERTCHGTAGSIMHTHSPPAPADSCCPMRSTTCSPHAAPTRPQASHASIQQLRTQHPMQHTHATPPALWTCRCRCRTCPPQARTGRWCAAAAPRLAGSVWMWSGENGGSVGGDSVDWMDCMCMRRQVFSPACCSWMAVGPGRVHNKRTRTQGTHAHKYTQVRAHTQIHTHPCVVCFHQIVAVGRQSALEGYTTSARTHRVHMHTSTNKCVHTHKYTHTHAFTHTPAPASSTPQAPCAAPCPSSSPSRAQSCWRGTGQAHPWLWVWDMGGTTVCICVCGWVVCVCGGERKGKRGGRCGHEHHFLRCWRILA